MSTKAVDSLEKTHPIGASVTYINSGRGHGNVAKIVRYLCPHDRPDFVAFVQLDFSGRCHVVSVNQLNNYYSRPVPQEANRPGARKEEG